MGLFRQPKIKDGIAGGATVLSMSNPRRDDDGALVSVEYSARIHVRFTLRVEVPGMMDYEVKYGCPVKPKKMPSVGTVLPVTVDRTNPKRLRIEWDAAPDTTNNPNGMRIASPIVVERSTVELDLAPGTLPADVDHLLRQHGVDLQALTGAFGASTSQTSPATGQAAADDTMLDTLERLVALRDAGALTEEEFAAQKARVLGGG